MTADSLNPQKVRYTPSENSHVAIGRALNTATGLTADMIPPSIANHDTTSETAPMNPSTGRAYREIVVGPAATQEPDTALQRFLGRPLSYDAFFAEMGIGGGGKPTP